MKNRLFTGAALFLTFTTQAQVTKVGNDTLMDVAGWNTEWFGDTQNGPSNEPLQYANVKAVISNTDLDVWGLAEVSNPTTFNTLLSDLTAYDGVLSSFSQTQKTAMIWKKAKFNLVSYGNKLTEQTYNYDFAGRPPLEVVLQTRDSSVTDTLYFYVLHLKANSGSGDQASYDRRKNAVGYLKTYLDQNRAGKKVFVVGDWNDDVNGSVVYIGTGYLETPFKNFLNDSAHYFFPSKRLSLAGEKSYVFGSRMIDHHMISGLLSDSFYVTNSSLVLSQLSTQISNYGNTTSDHYPVVSRYNMKRYPKLLPTGMNEINNTMEVSLYPNPAGSMVNISGRSVIQSVQIINSLGETVLVTTQTNINIESLPEGMYIVKLTGEDGFAVRKLLVDH